MTMRRAIPLLLGSLLAASVFGATLPLPPESVHADTESVTNMPLEIASSVGRLAVTLSLSASPTNCLEVSLGTDADGNGRLSPEETLETYGYDCGRWFVRRAWADSLSEEPCADEGPVSRTFVLPMRMLSQGSVMARVVHRGVGDVSGQVTARDGTAGLRIIAR